MGRDDYRARYRGSKNRDRTRGAPGKPETDFVAVTLTAQIILCVLILAAAQITKMVNEHAFASIKHEYVSLVGSGEGASISDYFSELRQTAGGIFSSLERFFGGLPGGGAPAEPMQELPPGYSPGPVTSEPPPAQPPEPTPPDRLADLRLEPMAIGGSAHHPRGAEAGRPDTLHPPEGSTLAPFSVGSPLIPPLTGTVTSPFAFRIHPISGQLNFHNGIDIAAARGQEIQAALSGWVERTGEDDIYGRYVLLRHTGGIQTFYAHCDRVLVREGMMVAQGHPIATVGDTGMTTGPHLHFAVIVDGLYADPMHALSRHIRIVER